MSSAALFRTARALLIGIGAYEDPAIRPLRFVRNDVLALRELVLDPAVIGLPPENVTVLVDEQATRKNILKSLKDMQGHLRRGPAAEPPLAIVFFAGHGAVDADAGGGGESPYLLAPHDAEYAYLSGTAIRYSDFQREVNRLDTDRVLLLLDACYSGHMTSGSVSGRDIAIDLGGFEATVARETLGKGRVTIASSTPEQRSFEVEALGHGIFTYCLLKGLRGGCRPDARGLITHMDLFRFLDEEVPALATRHSALVQRPRLAMSDAEAPIVIARKAVSLRACLESLAGAADRMGFAAGHLLRELAGSGTLPPSLEPVLRPFLEDAAGAELAQLGPCLGDFLADAAFELFRKPQLLGPKHYAIVKEVVGDPGSLCADDRVIAEEVVAAVLGQILPQQAAGTLLRALRERTSGSGSERAGAAALARPPQPHPTRSPAAQPPAPLPPASPPPAAPRQALGPRLPPAPLPPRAAPPVEPIAPSEPPSRPRPALDWAVVTLPGRGSRLPPIEWIPVPAGETIVGSSKKTALAAAALDCSVTVDSRTVRVPAFEIARYTTTNEDYATFVRATRHSAPPHWATAPAAPYPPGLAQLPVVNVDRSDAEAYARWVGGRLPTIEEWTRASYGDDDRLYPWGDEYDGHERCNSSERTVLTSVDAHPEGASPYGCLNMCGNVFEWVEGERPRSARGGSCAQPCRIVGLTFLEVDIPEDEDSQVGFRLAADSSMPEGEAKARGLVGIGGGPFVRGAPPDIFERLGERVRVGGDLREGILRHARETASLPSFFIGRTAVTNADFLRYVEETGAHRPPGWQPGDTPFSPGQALFPVCGVPKAEARAYCAWAGGRLPTGLEWEKAARGTGGRIYPWGDEYDVARCNEAASVTLAPVEMFPTGRGPFGLLQSVGNVHEWTATIERTGYALTGGGSCKKSCQRFSLRGVWPQFALDARQNDLGFRVARDRRTS